MRKIQVSGKKARDMKRIEREYQEWWEEVAKEEGFSLGEYVTRIGVRTKFAGFNSQTGEIMLEEEEEEKDEKKD